MKKENWESEVKPKIIKSVKHHKTLIEEIFSKNINDILDAIYDFNPIKMEPSEWVEKTVFLTSAESKYPGYFSYDRSPYSKEIIDNMSPSSDIEMQAIMKCVQSGYTAGVIVPFIAYIIDQMPCNVIFVSGSDQLVKDTIRDRLDPVIQNSGNLKDKIRPNSLKKANHRTGDTDVKKEFLGGSLTCLTYKPSKLRQYSAKVVLADEFDDAPRENITEGSIRLLLQGRTVSFGDSKKLCYVSSPTTKGISNIEEVYEMGDKRKWNWCCPNCETYIPILWTVLREDGTYGGIKWELNDDNELIEESVHYECQNCRGIIEYRQKTQLNMTGMWVPTAKPMRPQYRSYSFNALCIPSGFDSWIMIVYEWLKACPKGQPVDIGLLKTFTNTRLGELWEDRGTTPRMTALMSNVGFYPIGKIPDKTCEEEGNGKIALISLVCDLGGIMDVANQNEDVRLDWEIVAHTSNGQIYSIDHGSIGTFKRSKMQTQKDRDNDSNRERYTFKEGVKNSVWPIFKEQIYRTLEGESGTFYDIDITIVDTGHFTKLSYNFIQSIKDRKVIGIKGDTIETYRKTDKNTPIMSHSRENKGLLYILDVNLLKEQLASNMALTPGTDGTQPNGFMNFPQPEGGKYNKNNYFDHYESEHRVPMIKNGMEVGFTWKKKRENNHFWDVAVYTLASREIFIADLKLWNPDYRTLTWELYCQMINE
jgi:phage terminase large subunit GpA-like protein